MPARRSILIALLLLFTLAFTAHPSPRIQSNATEADAASRLVVFEGFYRPT